MISVPVYRLLKKCYEKGYQPGAPELAELESLGLTPGFQTSLTHDQGVERLLQARRGLSPEQVGDGFLFSLTSRRVEYRTGLAAFAFAMHFPEHAFQPISAANPLCAVCGMRAEQSFDFAEMTYRRLDWGNGLRLDPVEPAFDLEFFKSLPPVAPDPADERTFRSILEALAEAQPRDTGNKVSARIKGLLGGNKYLRQYFLEALGICGVLETPDFPGYDKAFLSFARAQGSAGRPNKFVECDPPLSHWRGEYGLGLESLRRFFPGIQL